MIRVNFLEADLRAKRVARLKRRLTATYVSGCLLLLIAALTAAQNNYRIAGSYTHEFQRMKLKIDQVAPQFKKAVSLYQQRNRIRKTMVNLTDSTVEPAFLLQSLLSLSNNVPDNIWIEEIRFPATENTSKADNKKRHAANGKSLFLKGNLFVAMQGKTLNPLDTFQKRIQAQAPFANTQCQVNLHDMRIKKVDDRFAHDFAMRFDWIDPLR